MIQNKLKELISVLETYKVQIRLVLEYQKRNECKIFHLSVKLIASDSDIDEVFISTYQSILTKITNYASEVWMS